MKLKFVKYCIAIFIIAFTSSCLEGDDGFSFDTNLENNRFTFANRPYELNSIIIHDETPGNNNNPSDIEIILSNKTIEDINSGNDYSDVSLVRFNLTDLELQRITYSQVHDYEIFVEGSIENGEFVTGTALLSDDDSEADNFLLAAAIQINEITENFVSLSFSFARKDAQVINGTYSGSYLSL